MALALCASCGVLFDRHAKPAPATAPHLSLVPEPPARKARRSKKTAPPGAAIVAALDVAHRCCEPRTPNPILGCCLVGPTADGALAIAATDMLDWFEATVPLDDIAWEGPPVAVDCKRLHELAKAGLASVAATATEATPAVPATETEPAVRAQDGLGEMVARARSGSIQRIEGFHASDFPPRPSWDAALPWQVDAASFRTALAAVLPAVASDENRYGQNGIHIEAGPYGEPGDAVYVPGAAGVPSGCVRLVSTDGNRLHWSTARLADGCRAAERPWPNKMLLRQGAAERWLRLLKGATGQVDVAIQADDSPRSASLAVGNARILSRLMDGEFPDYRRVMPDEWERGYRFDALALAAAFKESLKVATDRNHTVACHFDAEAEAERLKLSVRNVDSGAWSTEVPMTVTRRPGPRMAQNEDGTETEFMPSASVKDIGFNAAIILDAIDTVLAAVPATGNHFLRWEAGADRFGPNRITADGDDPAMATAIVMPIRID